MGGANRPPTDAELAPDASTYRARRSTRARAASRPGLSYAPGLFATIDELTALAGRRRGRAAVPHAHAVRTRRRRGIGRARRSRRPSGRGVELNISHLYPARGPGARGGRRAARMIDDARGRGLDVTFDLTVFPRGGGAWVQSLPRGRATAAWPGLRRVIRDPESRRGCVAYFEGPDVDWWMADWDDQLIVQGQPAGAGAPGRPDRSARSRASGARRRMDTALDLVIEEGQFWIAPTIKRQARPRSADRQPAGRADRRRVRRPSGAATATSGSCPRASGRSR